MTPSTSANEEVATSNGNATIPSTTRPDGTPVNNFPPPKTDKPRPHVCQTCGRSFARLEHLKRHERSHTKEKPFECPQCTRCFARRDLLLRHQQKLHQAGNTSSRPRSGRRESTSGIQTSGPGARGRKNSIAGGVANGHGAGTVSSTMRPRANTISHIDGAAINLFMNHPHQGRPHEFSGYGHHPSFSQVNLPAGFSHPGAVHSLPKLETHGLASSDIGGGLKTAPISMMTEGFNIDKLFGTTSTINPAQLHFGASMATPNSPFPQGFHPMAPGMDEDDSLDWTGGTMGTDVFLNGPTEAVADGSSPSAISTTSQSGFSEVMVDGSNNPAQTTDSLWTNPIMVTSSQFAVDPVSAAVFPELLSTQPSTIAPKELHEQTMNDGFLLSNTASISTMSPTTAGTTSLPHQFFQHALNFGSDTTSISSTSVNGSGRLSSVTTLSTDSITDATRQALLFNLSQHSGFSNMSRKFSQASTPSPTSPGWSSISPVSLPSTADLQRYVNAYIHYFHPHMPFLHVPTLSFDSPAFTSNMRAHQTLSEGIVGGGGCLILAMAAIGASYEFDNNVAKELFEAAKRMISIYLEERRKTSVTTAGSSSGTHGSPRAQKTPLWLVQAMLLNLIFGHQCGDKVTVEIATTHCAALVSLAKAAELDKPDPDVALDESRSYALRNGLHDNDVDMMEDNLSPRSWRRLTIQETREDHSEWFRWKSREERKRTLYSVFVLSSLLVTAYNHQPRILNSELHLDLPCEENLWAADSPQTWNSLGGLASAQGKAVSFAEALTFLLTASQRKRPEVRLSSRYQAFGSTVPLEELPTSELKPSTFGCYVLINALHVYIWETRQRHEGRQWKSEETEQMHAQVEPALGAWQAAWRSNPHHNLERPNPYGPLPADSIPLLDLAYVRLFVNLGRSKEAFWIRDFEVMAEELGRGSEIIQHAAESSRDSSETPEQLDGVLLPTVNLSLNEKLPDLGADMSCAENRVQPGQNHQTSRRERHLRKAAFYAADSLSMADKLGATFAEFTSRELPIQAAMCTFDCAQVLAEWISTVQERVGKYLGILGRDEIDFGQVPAIVLLEDEDCKLLNKINDILSHADVKIAFDAASMGTSPEGVLGPYSNMKNSGYGSRILLATAYMLDKAAVWGITRVMAQAMRTHADFLRRRAESSLMS